MKGFQERFFSAEVGVSALFGLAFQPIKKRMEDAPRRYTNLDEMKCSPRGNSMACSERVRTARDHHTGLEPGY